MLPRHTVGESTAGDECAEHPGGALGVATGTGIAWLLPAVVPGLPAHTRVSYVIAALIVSLGVGLLSGVLPARRAAALDPVEALRTE